MATKTVSASFVLNYQTRQFHQVKCGREYTAEVPPGEDPAQIEFDLAYRAMQVAYLEFDIALIIDNQPPRHRAIWQDFEDLHKLKLSGELREALFGPDPTSSLPEEWEEWPEDDLAGEAALAGEEGTWG